MCRTIAASRAIWCSVRRAPGAARICVTVDSPTQGARNREERARAELPERPLPNLKGKDYLDPTLTWKDIDWLRGFAKTPVLLKGILNPDDAAIAVKAGVSGIMVSNHGGRNLDTVPATIDALPLVVEKVAGRIPVIVDGGDSARDGRVEGAGAGRERGRNRAAVSLWAGGGGRGGRHARGGDFAQGVRNGDDAYGAA